MMLAAQAPSAARLAVEVPAWQDALATGLPVHSQFILSGNVRDVHAVDARSVIAFVPLHEAVWKVLRSNGYAGLLLFDPIDGRAMRSGTGPVTIASIIVSRSAISSGSSR